MTRANSRTHVLCFHKFQTLWKSWAGAPPGGASPPKSITWSRRLATVKCWSLVLLSLFKASQDPRRLHYSREVFLVHNQPVAAIPRSLGADGCLLYAACCMLHRVSLTAESSAGCCCSGYPMETLMNSDAGASALLGSQEAGLSGSVGGWWCVWCVRTFGRPYLFVFFILQEQRCSDYSSLLYYYYCHSCDYYCYYYYYYYYYSGPVGMI